MTIDDEVYKNLMKYVGMPDSNSLLNALKQVENIVSQHYESIIRTRESELESVIKESIIHSIPNDTLPDSIINQIAEHSASRAISEISK